MREVKPFYFDLTEEEIEEYARGAKAVLRSGQLILGEQTKSFEKSFAELIGCKHAISVNSGSAALEFLLRLKKACGKTVLVPTNSNFATVLAPLRAGAEVQYLDMAKETFAPSLAMVRAVLDAGPTHGRPPFAGILWVHIGGVISPEFPEVVRLCHERGLFMLEDCAHAHGSKLGGVRAGNLADGGAFSFFPTKVMTTGEGGMITTNDDEEDYIARSLRNQGKRGTDFGNLHHDFGNSSRIPELSAVLGNIQLKKLPGMIEKRMALADAITAPLRKAGLSFCDTSKMDLACHYKLIVHVPHGRETADVKKALSAQGVFAGGGVYELPCHRQPVFEGRVNVEAYPGADEWCGRHICPPLTTAMSLEDAEYVGQKLVEVLR